MSLSPCPCGSAEPPTHSALYDVDGGFVRRYSGACRTCGRSREFTFRLPESPLVAGSGEFRFGDGSRSELIDPGGWLAVADYYARLTPGDSSGLDPAGRRAARQNMARAAAAMDEVIAFLPRGAMTVPTSAFVSSFGRQVRDREPGRFGRARLEAVRDTYRQLLAELADDRGV